jgi:hypothetical protein
MKFLGNNYLCRETQEWTDESFTSTIGAPHCREIGVILRCILAVQLRKKFSQITSHFLFCRDWRVYVAILWLLGLTFPTRMSRAVLSDRASWYCTMLHIYSYMLCSRTQSDICAVPLNRRNSFINASSSIFITCSKFTLSSC